MVEAPAEWFSVVTPITLIPLEAATVPRSPLPEWWRLVEVMCLWVYFLLEGVATPDFLLLAHTHLLRVLPTQISNWWSGVWNGTENLLEWNAIKEKIKS